MNIVEMNVDELKEYENNPRFNDDAVPTVAKSIKEFGFKVPIFIDQNNTVICGHTRLKAARILNMVSVPCIIADDLTEDKIKAFRLVDNKTSEIANWNFEMLDIEIEGISGLDMSDFGFMIEDITFDTPEDFKTYDENIETKHQCPKCGYEW